MNPPSECRFPRLLFAKADAGASARILRAKGPAPYQPRATPWVWSLDILKSGLGQRAEKCHEIVRPPRRESWFRSWVGTERWQRYGGSRPIVCVRG